MIDPMTGKKMRGAIHYSEAGPWRPDVGYTLCRHGLDGPDRWKMGWVTLNKKLVTWKLCLRRLKHPI